MVRKLLSYSFCAMLVVSGRNLYADDATFEQLLSRLQKTEERLADLEKEQTSPFLPVSRPFRSDLPIAVPPAEGDAVAADETDESPNVEDRLKKLEAGWEELDDAWSTFNKAEKKKKEGYF